MFPPEVVAPAMPNAEVEKPRLVFSFGAAEDSFFIGCGEIMEWANLPDDLEHILQNRASEVLALSLGEDDAFYCRYISKNKTEYTVTGNLPPRLEFLLTAWWANQYEVPYITLGPSNSYFFQTSSVTAYEHLPKRLEESLLALRDTSSTSLPPRAVTLGARGSYILLSDSGQTAFSSHLDVELDEKLALAPEKTVEMAVLSTVGTEDYVLVFGDGKIFYSVPDGVVDVFGRFTRVYHEALVRFSEQTTTARKGWEPEPEQRDFGLLAKRPHASPMSSPDSVPREMVGGQGGKKRTGRRRAGRGRLWEECRDEWCTCRTQTYRGARGAA